MRPFGAAALANVLVCAFAAGAVAVASFLVLIRYCDPADKSIPLPLLPTVKWVHANQFSIALGLLITQTTCGMLAWLCRRINEWSVPQLGKIQRVLDAVVEHMFNDRQPNHVYRATLFREYSIPVLCWLIGRWLGIVARSGKTYADSRTIFSISFGRHAHNTGIAGECWWRANSGLGGQFLTILPDCRHSQDKLALTDYNAKGNISQNELAQINVRSSVFRAIAIRCKGKVWGVLVIDTTHGEMVPNTGTAAGKRLNDTQQSELQHAAETISLLIE